MRGLTRRWIGPESTAVTDGLSLVDRVIRERRLGGEGRAGELLARPTLNKLHPPAELPGADDVALRLVEAVKAGKRIAIYGDYDADGVTSLAVMWHVLTAVEPTVAVELFAPNRFEHGYGLNSSVLRQMHERGVQTVVTVDCGITAVEQAKVARELGLQLLITDHHTLEPNADGSFTLPDADAIAHPALPGARAPFVDLCGAAVAFKVASLFAKHWYGGERVPEQLRPMFARLVPLVALGTVADVVPLVDENRIFAAVGLSIMQNSENPGLRALLDDAELNEGRVVNSEHIAFRLAPRLNAIGRLGHAAEAVELLTTADAARARVIAAALAQHNTQRRAIELEIFNQAVAMVAADPALAAAHAIVLSSPAWHEGVVGVVCSKMVERFGRPVILLCERPDGSAKGSGRSIDGFDLVGAVRACAEHLESCGGHAAAVGLTVRAGACAEFARAFTSRCAESIAVEDLVSLARFDAYASLSEITAPALAQFDALRPFGRGNREPAILLRELKVAGAPAVFGSARTHLEVHVAVEGMQRPVRAVWWSAARHAAAVGGARTIDVIARPKVDEWRGKRTIQLDVVDIAVSAGR
jgi:single-stranded-DNA-specific exonuclease